MPLIPVDEKIFLRPCQRYPIGAVLPLLARWSADGERWAGRHWPWVAFAIDQWLFSHDYHRTHNIPDVRPTDVKALLKRIAKNADAITKDLAALQMASNSRVTAAAYQAGHIGWLLTFVSLFSKYDFTAEDALNKGFSETEIGETLLIQNNLVERLTRLSVASGVAAQIAKDELLARHRSGADPMLPTLVSRLAQVWKSLTGRNAAAGKVAKVDEARPDFVIFVQAIAEYALEVAASSSRRGDLPVPPTHDMIATALRARGRGVGKKTASPV